MQQTTGFMALKFILAFIVLSIGIFTAFRFGLFGSNFINGPSITEFVNIPARLQITPSTTSTPSAQASTPSSTIKLLETPSQASTSQKFRITWFVDSDKIATISHTAVHYGKISKPDPKIPSDYPEKSAILKGTIPATFSAELSIGTRGLYYYRAHAIIDETHVWSDEKTIDILSPVQSVATTSAVSQ